jgi:hypothetical protein
MSWTGGAVGGKATQGIDTPIRRLELIYPEGFPARFIEARLLPSLSPDVWGMLGAHVNVDGSACFVAGEGWGPQMTASTALRLLEDWWFNYWVAIENYMADYVSWPSSGKLDVPEPVRAAISTR